MKRLFLEHSTTPLDVFDRLKEDPACASAPMVCMTETKMGWLIEVWSDVDKPDNMK